MGTPSLTRRLWLAFALMAALTLGSVLVGWFSLHYVGRVEQANTQALLPTMNMARQLSEAGAYELFSAQSLSNADSEREWLAQGRMLTAQSLKISRLLDELRRQGFDIDTIAQQETEITRSLGEQGALVGQRLQLRMRARALSAQVAAAAEQIAELAKGQASNAATAAGATQAGIYDLIEQRRAAAAEQALDRLIDIDLEYLNQMSELRLSALRVQQMIMALESDSGRLALSEQEERLAQALRILQRRQQRVEDPRIRAQIAQALGQVAQYRTLVDLYRQDNDIYARLQALSQNNLDLFTRFSAEISRQVSDIELRNAAALEHLQQARRLGLTWLTLLGGAGLLALCLILWRVVYRSLSQPLAHQTAALQRLLDGDFDSPFPDRAGVRELDTIGRLMEAFRTSVRALRHQRQHLADLVQMRTAELQALVVEHRQARAEAENADRAKSAFLAAMSHEIRTPLHGILGTAQLLAEQPISPQSRGYVQAINDSGESLLAVLNDVLDYSAIEAGSSSVVLNDEPFSPRQLLDSLLRLAEGRLRERPLRLAHDYADALPAWLQGDPRRIRQIVMNLLNNALRFTERGVICVSCGCDETHWWIAVQDSGCGIDPAQQAAIFQPFVQLSARRGGTGLGLAICRGLAQAMAGSLELSSTPGKGSRFCLRLPLRRAALPPPEAPAQAWSLVGRRLLLIEDNPLSQRISAEMLQSAGVQVHIAGSAAEAQALLARDTAFDAALVDFDLPDSDGPTLARQMAEAYPQLKRIGFSAHVLDEAQHRRIRPLFCGMIQKPVPRAELCRLIAHALADGEHSTVRPTRIVRQIAAPLDDEQLAEDVATFGQPCLTEWLALFRQHSLPLLAEIAAARAAGDADQVKGLAHRLKSSCASLGMRGVADACLALERAPLTAAALDEPIREGLAALEAWLAKVSESDDGKIT
ncbi:TMAO reductase system sensor histidine kinase/response regulator TorS [Edwardsiella piscicida]|uniref:TMAO reductase system sensor histidine kinase/response regulator TorS n=1 Tax=Edwardsiella piscicida TaxID=1263550 RepID=UPI000D50B653|nr:TMAO reductase system sensor histidine kinase/response regulator TorS [Edwardsiella piscicida]ELM3736838.1 TMAO reductase system sensor histidine kinase/response regulator TorS [Edwardsiella piscicida]QBB12119.1 TMAO reductase system sensor histidine kinase/response regulator TorS [Edwardsiella piscicida]UCQ14976.1 TMAO reductase system sensor histidine kinase/response regulator TorS [Edwardsiella piscicida]UCQ38163.1 TMAO reductase system sensor histidine kinase/response regulator TorS [Edw